MSETFRATRGKVAIKKTSAKSDSIGAIIYDEAEHQHIKTGVIVSVGDLELMKNGKSIPFEPKVGDHVLYTLKDGFVSYGGFDMIQQKSVIGFCNEGTVVR